MFTPFPQGQSPSADAVPASCASITTPACRTHVLLILLTKISANLLRISPSFVWHPCFCTESNCKPNWCVWFRWAVCAEGRSQGVFPLVSGCAAFTSPDRSQSFLKSFRKDLSSSTTFGLQALDGGSNPQAVASAGIEAVRPFWTTIENPCLTVVFHRT